MQTPAEVAPNNRLRRRQFSLGTLLAAITMLALVMGWLADRNQLTTRLNTVESSLDAEVAKRTADLQRRLSLQARLHVSEHYLPAVERAVDGLLKKNVEVWADVTTVSLGDNRCTDAEVADLVRFPTIRCVHLHGSQYSDAAVEHLAKLPNLKWAWLGGPWITDKTLAALSKLNNLDGLGLDHSNISDEGLEQLGTLTDLETLLLIGTPITDQGLHHLIRLTKLSDLRLDETLITDAGLAELAGLPNLRVVSVGKTQVTTAGREQLKMQLPDCLILP